MAALGAVTTELNALDPPIRKVLTSVFEYVLKNLSFGDGTKAENFSLYRVESTTASVAGTEFSIVHGLDHAPSKLIPALDLNTVNAQLVPLQVSRVADAKRVYLKSTSTSASFICYLE